MVTFTAEILGRLARLCIATMLLWECYACPSLSRQFPETLSENVGQDSATLPYRFRQGSSVQQPTSWAIRPRMCSRCEAKRCNEFLTPCESRQSGTANCSAFTNSEGSKPGPASNGMLENTGVNGLLTGQSNKEWAAGPLPSRKSLSNSTFAGATS